MAANRPATGWLSLRKELFVDAYDKQPQRGSSLLPDAKRAAYIRSVKMRLADKRTVRLCTGKTRSRDNLRIKTDTALDDRIFRMLLGQIAINSKAVDPSRSRGVGS